MVFSGHTFYQWSWLGKEQIKDATTKFINHFDNTLHYKSQVELSLQMSYSNQAPYQNPAATRTCDAATTMLLPLQLTADAELGVMS